MLWPYKHLNVTPCRKPMTAILMESDDLTSISVPTSNQLAQWKTPQQSGVYSPLRQKEAQRFVIAVCGDLPSISCLIADATDYSCNIPSCARILRTAINDRVVLAPLEITSGAEILDIGTS